MVADRGEIEVGMRGEVAGADVMTQPEAIALKLAILLIVSVLLARMAGTRTGVLMIAGGLLAIALVVSHQWSRSHG